MPDTENTEHARITSLENAVSRLSADLEKVAREAADNTETLSRVSSTLSKFEERFQKIEADLAQANDGERVEAIMREIAVSQENNRAWIDAVLHKYFATDRPANAAD